jgi:uncharacterized protein YndB with AHSA1/START domain
MRAVPLVVLSMLSTPAAAEVVSASSNGFHVRETVQVVVPTDRAYAAFSRLPEWWNKVHTYSGDSANLGLALNVGGCFCERLKDGGGVEHMRISFVDPGKRIVFTGALGPLLFQATIGVMDVQFERIAGGAKITLDYKAAGFAEGGADKLAPIVDSVLAEQMTRYRKFAVGQPKT